MSIRIADAINEELTPEMREVFDRADQLLELEARYLAQHLSRTQLAFLYGHERAVGDLRDVAVVLRACEIADAPLLGPEWPSLFLRRAAELREQLSH